MKFNFLSGKLEAGRIHIIAPIKIEDTSIHNLFKSILSNDITLFQVPEEGKELEKVAVYSHFLGSPGDQINILFSPIGKRGESLIKSIENGTKLSIQVPLDVDITEKSINSIEKSANLWKVVPFGEKPALKTAIIKEYFTKMPLSDIDSAKLKAVPTQELLSLHHRVHQLWEKEGINKELVANSHQFIIEEMKRRKLNHNIVSTLDETYKKEISKIKIDTIIEDPDHICLTGSRVRGDFTEDSDWDIHIRRNKDVRDTKLEERIVNEMPLLCPGYNKDKHRTEFIWKEDGPYDEYIPLYHKGLIPIESKKKIKVLKAALSLDSKIVPQKTKGGYGSYEFGDPEAAWESWGKGIVEAGHKIDVEVKYDGFRTISRIGNEVSIETEDANTNLAEVPGMSTVVNELKKLPTNTILDGELVLIADGKQVPRKDMKSYLKKEPIGEYTPYLYLFDILLYRGKDTTGNTWTERRSLLEAIGPDKYTKIVQSNVVESKESFLSAIKKCSNVENSEGAMLKDTFSTYNYHTGRTTGWAKYKSFKEIRGKVVDKIKTKSGDFMYDIEIAGGIPVGRTYTSNLDIEIGDILEVRVAEIKYDKESDKFSWDNPIPASKKPDGTSLSTKEQLIELSESGRSVVKSEEGEHGGSRKDFDVTTGDKGKFVMQLHSIGYTEDEAKKIKESNDFPESGASIHYDIRMRIDDRDYLIGFTPVIGSLSNRKKLLSPESGDKTLVAGFKLHQPLVWLTMGKGNMDVFEPGSPGASTNTYGAMKAVDSGTVEIGTADEHYIEFKFNGEHLKGRYILQYVPTGGSQRKWMFSHPEKQTFDIEKDSTDRLLAKLNKNGILKLIKYNIGDDLKGFHYTLGVVLEPDVPDSDGTLYSEDEIEKACFRYLLYKCYVGDMHQEESTDSILAENYILRGDMKIGNQVVRKGTWLQGHLIGPSLWDKIQNGERTGLSFGGWGFSKTKELEKVEGLKNGQDQ